MMSYDQLKIAVDRALATLGGDIKTMSWFKRNWKRTDAEAKKAA